VSQLTADVTGEYFRKDVTEDQAGVPLYLDIQVVDIETCEVLPNVALDIWHCNSTGVYSGVVANGNGDSSVQDNINATFLRGIQGTDSDGVVQFETIVPGHYTGRTNHIHTLVHTNWTLLDNNTISGGEQGTHVGQLFFDQDLITEVEAVAPYNTNTQQLTVNADDMIMSQESDSYDPVIEYVLLGDTVADGIFAWISVGVNASVTYDVSPAVIYGENGGVANPNQQLGGPGGGGPGGPGGFPSGFPGGSGTPPTGTPTSTPGSSATNTGACKARKRRSIH
jgi:protocatechuate 3,4-dioxygenase beta subunit